ncbi:hypothetical protein [Butyrivibrio sp. AD3002]|uniref:hypothetical protein n=1 Tax=Butyrivibrio sp. AD3002 TaxID=1280670 RepID=UPI0003B60067|nr:hypothetical protein [Butyrivibrio sp. AD3002]
MNRYEEQYNFRLANVNDVPDIMKFIHDEWSESHIFSYDRELFLWQYGRNEYGDNKNINFVLMERKSGGLIGIVGFVAYDENNKNISPAMTKIVTKDILPMSGLELMKRQMALVGEKEHFASGTNSKTILPLYIKVFKHVTGIMQQYYMLNPDFEDYLVASPGEGSKISDYHETGYGLREVENFDDLLSAYDLDEKNERMIYKSPKFIEKRYFNHPVYSYRKWIVTDEKSKPVGVLFGREVTLLDRRLLRLVDYRGNPGHLSKLGKALHMLMKAEKYEYIDLMVSDLSDYHLDEAGFELLDPDGDTIIPNYFEPFVKENIKNYYQSRTNIVIFKADGDQDRPNTRNTQ